MPVAMLSGCWRRSRIPNTLDAPTNPDFVEVSPRIGHELQSSPLEPGFGRARSSQTRHSPRWVLEPRAIRLLDTLPAEMRLSALRRSFPHVVNRIASSWNTPREMQKTFQSLLIDERGGRDGFPSECVAEISELADYYFSVVLRGAEPSPRISAPE